MRLIKSSNLNRGLVGAWCPSVAGNGLLLPDLSGYGNHGTLTNMDASDWVGTDRGRALDFDGVDDRVVTGDAISCRVNRMTVSAWVRLNALGSTEDNNAVITTDTNYTWYFTVGGGKVNFYRGGPYTWLVGNAIMPVGVWAHCVGWYNGVTRAVYLNSVLDNSVADAAVANYGSTNQLYIGRRGDNTNTINGQIADVRVWSRALSPSEIKQLYEGGPGYGLRQERKRSRFAIPVKLKRGARSPRKVDKGNLKQGLVGAWCPSVAGSGLLLPDLSPYGNHGTLQNMDAADWVGTDRGRALDFDGSDDYVQCPNNPSLRILGNLTISAWINPNTVTGTRSVINNFVSGNCSYIFEYGRTNGKLTFLQNGDSVDATSNGSIVAGSFVHAVVTRTGTTGLWDISFYIDGKLDRTQTTSVNPTSPIRGPSIGSLSPAANLFYLDGKIPELRIYNRALSPSEIKQLYEGGPGFGLRQERKRSRFQVQGFNAGRFRRQQLIGTGVY